MTDDEWQSGLDVLQQYICFRRRPGGGATVTIRNDDDEVCDGTVLDPFEVQSLADWLMDS